MVRSAIAALLLAAAAALPARPAAPGPGFVSAPGNGLRHLPTGIAIPASLAGMARTTSTPGGDPFVAIYAERGRPDERWVSVSVGRVRKTPDLRAMRESSRNAARAGRKLTILSEGLFPWPGHPRAKTFHGAYVVDGIRHDYWTAWDRGFGVFVVASQPGNDVRRAEALGAAVEGRIFGG
ncbi:MAG: hypothetical protein ACJ8ER_02965 [Allosphingosinicella sp.]